MRLASCSGHRLAPVSHVILNSNENCTYLISEDKVHQRFLIRLWLFLNPPFFITFQFLGSLENDSADIRGVYPEHERACNFERVNCLYQLISDSLENEVSGLYGSCLVKFEPTWTFTV